MGKGRGLIPYITAHPRCILNSGIETFLETFEEAREVGFERDGCLNYSISTIINELYDRKYIDLNAAIGVLECAKLELYRRVVAPYEDTKIKENGDVYV